MGYTWTYNDNCTKQNRLNTPIEYPFISNNKILHPPIKKSNPSNNIFAIYSDVTVQGCPVDNLPNHLNVEPGKYDDLEIPRSMLLKEHFNTSTSMTYVY